MNPAGTMLGPWSSFYVMIGSSAAALTGLMFVVITLVNDTNRRTKRSSDGISTFSTPTVLHFCAPLFVAATVSAPWEALRLPAVLIAALGAYGTVYVSYLMVRASRLESYHPDVEDWICYSVLPLCAYIALCAGGLGMLWLPSRALFAVGGASLLLIFIGIRNSWDVVTYLAINGPSPGDDSN
ncbi:MAG TPA: hypothetical protein VN936_07420 [Candidatus Acidoferrum sp.]|nr:hypothetical protein [Candidatus Acidoferrum sp.]